MTCKRCAPAEWLSRPKRVAIETASELIAKDLAKWRDLDAAERYRAVPERTLWSLLELYIESRGAAPPAPAVQLMRRNCSSKLSWFTTRPTPTLVGECFVCRGELHKGDRYCTTFCCATWTLAEGKRAGQVMNCSARLRVCPDCKGKLHVAVCLFHRPDYSDNTREQ